MAQFDKKVIITGRYKSSQPIITDTILHLYHFLKKKVKQVGVEEETSQSLSKFEGHIVPKTQLADYDLMVVVGGDGSIINASLYAVEHQIPVVGINRGRLGFLTDISPDEIESEMMKILQGQYTAESRFLLEASIVNEHEQVIFANAALNDIVLLPGEHGAHMIEFSIEINQHFVCALRADGLIIATPTGSTAYALSGGGPILHPNLDAIVLVPMFPHTLSNRPIVIDANSEIKIQVVQHSVIEPKVSYDGHERIPLPEKSTLVVKKKNNKLTLLHPTNYNYFETLRKKLSWQHKH